jgi:hypothetical protein
VAVAKKKKNKKPNEESAAVRLDEIESRSQDLADWIGDNPMPILAAGGVILLAAAIYGIASSGVEGSAHAASTEIASVKNEFRQAMGGSYAGLPDIPELANPEAAKDTREQYLGRFQQLAVDHSGSEMGSYALIQAGMLQSALEDSAGAIASFEQALEPYDNDAPMRGILLERLALLHEERGEASDAVKQHIAASNVTGYPLRYFALLNAARLQAEMGEVDAAIANFDRITTESPDLLLPEHTEAMLREAKAKRSR